MKEFDNITLTTIAFLIGLALIDDLNSTEQNAVGNFIMLIGQTLATNGSYDFKKEWHRHIGKDTLLKVNNIINNEINKL